MWWSHHGCGFFPFGLLFVVFFVVLCFSVFRFLVFRNFNQCYRRPRHFDGDPEAILKRRLANGEITEAEYKQLKDLVKE